MSTIIAGNNLVHGGIVSGGRQRKYLLYVPLSYVPTQPTPLVVCLHGYADWPAHQMWTSRWNQLADENGFLVAYPEGTGILLHWATMDRSGKTRLPDDVRFLSDLIDRLEQEYNVDPARIYANGHSNGGGMSFMLACKLSERIAAIGGVSGAYLYPLSACSFSRPVSMIAFHGTHDRVVPYWGGRSFLFNYPFPVVPDWIKALALRNGCDETPLHFAVKGEVSGLRYVNGNQGTEVVFYTIQGGGHTWPGGGKIPRFIGGHTTQDVNATRVMWDFFQRFSLAPNDEP
ncbi:MAG: PHB depolymerase family esterase [Anaerolineaceae bacterium]|nr:PHB depolymerase family esterase [Anaerolineaceae bacterium]